MSTMPVSSLIGSDVIRVAPETDLFGIADALTKNDIGVVVVGDARELQGVVSERDLVHALAQRRDPDATRAADMAHTALVWCDASSTIDEVAMEMMDRWVRHVLVESDGRLIGIVSARDLLGAYAASEGATPT
jgi:CBS domain-containing protein